MGKQVLSFIDAGFTRPPGTDLENSFRGGGGSSRSRMSGVADETGKLQGARIQLQRVLRSDAFRHSDSLRHLLAYLGEKSLNGQSEDLKEYTIGIEACGKPASYDPQKDASVRVQLGRLRQKLEEYYRTEGLADPIALDLPKGRFTILFHPRQDTSIRTSPFAAFAWWMRAHATVVVLSFLLVLAVAWAVWVSARLREYEAGLHVAAQAQTVRDFSPVWGSFLSHNVPTVVVFGSPAFFASGHYPLLLRLYSTKDPSDPRSSPDFAAVDSKVGPLAGPRWDYASMGDAIAVQRLTEFFGSAGVALRALPAHLAVWDSVKDGNLIFVGAWRMHPLLRRLPITHDFELGADDQIHNLKPQAGEQAVYTTPNHRNVMTYAMVGAFAGLKPGRDVLVVTAHSSPGAIGAVDFLTSPGSVKLMAQRLGLSSSGPRKYYQMLLRIHVDNDVPVKTEYITHHFNP